MGNSPQMRVQIAAPLTVLIPEENTRDLKEIPEIVTKGMEIIPVSRMDQVLEVALTEKPEAIEWNFDENASPPASIDPPEGDEAAGLPH